MDMKKRYIKWLDKHVLDSFNDKTIFISGGHSGIALEVTRYCLAKHMNVIWGARNIEKANCSKEILLKEFNSASIKIYQLDLADISSIKSFVSKIKQDRVKFDYFYNNAGVYRMPKTYTKDGLDITIGTNFIGTYLLNKLILAYVVENKFNTKFIFTTSVLAYFHKINYDDFFLEKNYNKIKSYSYSKRETIHMAKYFTEKYPSLSFNLVHPGSTYTPLINKGYQSNFIKKAGKLFMKAVFHSPSKAALCTLFSMSEINKNNMICPRGLFNLSGYPQIKKVNKKLYSNYQKSIEIADKVVNI